MAMPIYFKMVNVLIQMAKAVIQAFLKFFLFFIFFYILYLCMYLHTTSYMMLTLH